MHQFQVKLSCRVSIPFSHLMNSGILMLVDLLLFKDSEQQLLSNSIFFQSCMLRPTNSFASSLKRVRLPLLGFTPTMHT